MAVIILSGCSSSRQQQQIHPRARWQEAMVVMAAVAKANSTEGVLRQALPPEERAQLLANLSLEKTSGVIE